MFPYVVGVAYDYDHTREDGSSAYELEDKFLIRRILAYQPRISKELKAWLKGQLDKRFIAKQIYKKHMQNWYLRMKMKLPDMRNDFVQLKDIVYYESRL